MPCRIPQRGTCRFLGEGLHPDLWVALPQDRRDSASLYDTLENQLIPLYYDRDDHGLPRGWIERMKRTIRTLGWRFNTDRMVIDYANSCYLPAAGAKSSHMR